MDKQSVNYFQTSIGGKIYQIPVQCFPGLDGWVYLVLVEDENENYRVLIDSGSGFGCANQDLEKGLQVASQLYGEEISLASLTHVLITHGHIDHFGGMSYIRPRTPARVGIHELDVRNLTNYEERLTIISQRLDEFLIEAGLSPDRRKSVIDLYMSTKSLHRSIKVDFTYDSIGMQLGPFKILHVPGHCAGQVVIQLHDVLFSGDHVLEKTTPHQSPEHLTLYTGLGHYLESLEHMMRWVNGVKLTLGGHEGPMYDLGGRVSEIRTMHRQRLKRVVELLSQPHTIEEISFQLFGEVHGYNVLLALEEAGAHVEYLYQRGVLEIHNLEDLERGSQPVAIYYHCL
ncbi:MAG: MBL fold metallo-hydrolase [Anaerolineales bacterium]|nr:MBL fold metallo-hydrolase [Anaerolineales bacterium]